MDTNRLKQHQRQRMRVAADRAHQIFHLADRHGITAEAAEVLYVQAKGDWDQAGELASHLPTTSVQ